MNKKFYKQYLLRQEKKRFNSLPAETRKLINKLNAIARFPVCEIDHEIDFQDVHPATFEEVEKDTGNELDKQEEETIIKENKEYYKTLIKLVQKLIILVQVASSESMIKRVDEEIEAKYGYGMAETVKILRKYNGLKGFIKEIKNLS